VKTNIDIIFFAMKMRGLVVPDGLRMILQTQIHVEGDAYHHSQEEEVAL
jgi:hypothetical protein